MKTFYHRTGRKLKSIVLILLLTFFIVNKNKAQSPCMPSVPSYTINLTGQPAGIWSSPNVSRNDQCCTATSPDQCIYFNLTLDTNTAGIQIDMIGADPAGSLFYDIGCTGHYPGGQIKCISGSGSHLITFCKPGANKNIYKITSISRPLFPKDDTVRVGCRVKLVTLGIVNNSATWQSIYPGTPGQYDNYLDSTNVASPTYTPVSGAPAYVDYKVCGFPIASGCGYNFTVCDTVRVYNYPSLGGVVNPNPASFCNVGPGSGVNLTGNASGGLPGYTYTWYNSSNTFIGSGSTYFASAAGTYNLEVKDALYDAVNCPSYYTTVSVSQGTIPVTDAGANQKVCAATPSTTLNGTVQYASGGIWSGGNGTFSPGNTYLTTTYTPSAGEIAAGFAKLYLTSSGAGGGCVNTTDSIIIYYSPLLNATIPGVSLPCHNNTTNISANVTGGTLPYSYYWNTGSVTNFITAGEGVYSVNVTDSVGCTAAANYTLVAPTALSLTFSTTDASTNGGNDGASTVNIAGGTSPYTVLWNPTGSTSTSITNLVYGIYNASVTDNNGCLISGSTVVNEPRCLSLTISTSSTDALCYGSADGTATVSESGGTSPYTYTWNTSPAQNNATVTNLDAGVYTVIVEDANLCHQTANITISEPGQLTNIMTHTDVTTIGGNNGSATANPFGGTMPYTYLWNTSATSANINNLIAGSYTIDITDNKGCIKTDSVTITQPPCNNLTLNVLTNNVTCYNGANGSALAIVSGSSGSYTVDWSTGSSGLSINNLLAGNYSVTVTDSKKCIEYFNFTITQPTQLSVGLSETDISCYNANDGSIELTVSGGTFPYSFSWNNGSSSEDLSNLAPGTYSVQVIDANGCTSSSSATITEPGLMTTSYTVQNVSCIYGANGAIDLNVSGGTVPYAYSWSTGAVTQDISGLNAGGYIVNIIDGNGCNISEPLIIAISQPDSVQVDSFIVSCSVPGSNQTQVSVIPTGGYSGTFQVSFDNGASYGASGVYTAILSNNTTYSVLLKDGNNCISLLADNLTIGNETKIDSIIYSKCYSIGTTNTPVAVYPSNGAGSPYSVSFTNGSSYLSAGTYTSNINIASTYSVIVKDNKGCISAPQTITLPSILTSTVSITSNFNGQNISCFGAADGAVLASVNGGTGTYSYSWNTTPVKTTAAATGLAAGSYTVTINDINNCIITNTVTLTQPTAVSTTTSVTSDYNGQNISCFGVADGEATTVPSGGTGSYTYSWNTVPAQNTAIATSLAAGTYSVIVKDINNCAFTSSVTLTQPTALTSTVSITSDFNGQNISCFGAADGAVLASVNGGTGTYSYSWNTTPVQTTAAANNLTASSYTVTINDINNCITTNTITLTQPEAVTASTTITSNYNGQPISCNGFSDGEATVTPNGGTAPYTYSWNSIPAQTSPVASGLVSGTYSVMVKDINNCAFTSSVTLTQPTALTSTVSITSDFNGQNISCFGAADGAVLASVNGGTGTYSYSWNTTPIQTTAAATGLAAGSYTVTINDINNCIITNTVTLTQPTAVSTTTSVTSDYNGQNISCFGVADGEATTVPSGGTGSYTYSWNTVPAQNTAIATSLAAGTYSVIVKDINNCAFTSSVTLTQPTALTSTVSITSDFNGQNISCFGAADGAVLASVNGGTGTYSYSWNTTPVQTTAAANNLTASSYTVTINDINNCITTNTITLTQPSVLDAITTITSDYNGQNISCFGVADGESTVNPAGGTAPYTYLWTSIPVQTNTMADSLAAGSYSVTVTDANGCAITKDITLIQPTALNADLFDISSFNGFNVSCFGSSNGDIDIQVNGGTGSYTYNWSNGATTQDITNINAGDYKVLVNDINSCKDSLSITLTEPTLLVADIDSLSNYNNYNISCNGATNGSIYISVAGGVTGYTYIWSNNTSSQDLSNVGAGSYSVLITDINNCSISVDTLLTQPTGLTATQQTTNPLCDGMATGIIDVTVLGGVQPYNYNWSNGNSQEDLNNLAAGTYTLNFNDLNGCPGSLTSIINQPAALTIGKRIDGLKCYGDTIGNIIITVNGGTIPYTYLWSTGSTDQNLTNITSGNYSLTVTDAHACTLSDFTVIAQPDSLTLSLSSPVLYSGYNISEYNGNDGSINSVVNGGTYPYDYFWSNGSTDSILVNLTASEYFLTVTDTNGCRVSGSIKLTQPLILEMPQGYSPNNDSKNDFFVIHGIESYPDNSLTIYNRWGNIVYSKEGYLNEWDGNSNNGQALPNGTYFAILEVNKGEIILKGYVELRR